MDLYNLIFCDRLCEHSSTGRNNIPSYVTVISENNFEILVVLQIIIWQVCFTHSCHLHPLFHHNAWLGGLEVICPSWGCAWPWHGWNGAGSSPLRSLIPSSHPQRTRSLTAPQVPTYTQLCQCHDYTMELLVIIYCYIIPLKAICY